MFQKILLAQTPEEADLVAGLQSEVVVLPFDLVTRLHCEVLGYRFLDFSEIFDPRYHFEIESYGCCVTDGMSFASKTKSVASEARYIVRYFAYQIGLVEKIVTAAINYLKVDQVLVSGWRRQTAKLLSKENLVLSEIACALFPNLVTELDPQETRFCVAVSEYAIPKIQPVENCIASVGYNFSRLTRVAKSLGQPTAIISFDKPSLRSRTADLLRGLIRAEFKKTNTSFVGKTLHFDFTKVEHAALLDMLMSNVSSHLMDLEQRSIAIRRFVDQTNFNATFAFACRSESGFLLQSADEQQRRSVLISHGTVSNSLGRGDQNYKKVIAEAVFTGDCGEVAVQSKICERAVDFLKPQGAPIKTGNLIFASGNRKENAYFLYAVTVKDFYSMQFVGVETYWEHLAVLKALNSLTKCLSLPILVSLHPAAMVACGYLKNKFPHLKFSTRPIQPLLAKAAATISFSSTSIEDSLYSGVPVVLFDQWQRYQHCYVIPSAIGDYGAITYVNSSEELCDVLCTLASRQVESPRFGDYVSSSDWQENFRRLLA